MVIAGAGAIACFWPEGEPKQVPIIQPLGGLSRAHCAKTDLEKVAAVATWPTPHSGEGSLQLPQVLLLLSELLLDPAHHQGGMVHVGQGL